MSLSGELKLIDVAAGYRDREVIRDLTVHPIAPGSVVGLIGPNAAGKSTLLRAMAGLVAVTGKVALGATDLLALSSARRAALVGFMPQTVPDGVELGVLESILCALRITLPDSSDRDIRTKAVEALERVNAMHLALEPLDRLSGGQRQIASLAQAIASNPPVLLLDEPISALDLKYQYEVLSTIRGLANEGHIVVIVLHDLALAAQWATRCIVLNEGRAYADGPPREVIDEKTLAEVFGVTAHLERTGKNLHIAVSGIVG